jgi:glycogen debranching enzyme
MDSLSDPTSESRPASPETPDAPDKTGSIVVDGISYIPSSVLLTGIPKVSFKDNRAFGVVDRQGESPRLYSASSELGFFYNDTRYLSVWEMMINGMAPVALAHELRYGGSTVVFSMTNRDFEKLDGSGRVQRDTFLIRRVLTFNQDTLFETIEIKNFGAAAVELQIEFWAGGRFDDLFEVRGFPRARRGRLLSPQESVVEDRHITTLQYEGLDNQIRSTFIQRLFEVEKIRVSPNLAGHFTRITVPAKATVSLKTVVSFDQIHECKFKGVPYGQITLAEKMRLLHDQGEKSPFAALRFESDNAILDRSIRNAQTDIFMLMTAESSGDLYPYAGIPWYSAPFGRDGLITAYQLMPWYPNIARGVLNYCFETLGTKMDSFTDEQPGKVFHEMRRGEMANTREVPFIPYYGSVDSTPLSLILLHEYIRWSGDTASLEKWWPSALKALKWIETYGDPNGDGFLEYEKKSPTGLLNQGWKDSNDSVMHEDGRLAKAPISLCEVQAYAFRARMGMSQLATVLGQSALSRKLRMDALQLKSRFLERFWDSERGIVHLALDGVSQPCAVRSSNMGHCMWGQILPPEHAEQVAAHLMSDAMFNGYGIRTLADTEVAYNPLSYHNGSIWPHDNSLIMEGFRNYGYAAALQKQCIAMLGVLEASDDFRLPELFCGFRRRGNTPPVPYEVACKPQAWAAGSIFLMIKSMLGMSKDIDQNYIVFNSPLLTPTINLLEVKGLRGKDWELDLRFRRSQSGTSVDILKKSGSVRVLTVK